MQNWDRLRVFAAVAETGSIGAAADLLHITGSAVSQQVRNLERDVGAALVEPAGRGIRLTAAGSELAACGLHLRERIERAESAVAAIRDRDALGGPLRFGVVMSAIRTIVGPALGRLTARHPALRPSIVDGEAVDGIELVHTRRLDAALVESWQDRAPRGLAAMRAERILTEPVDLALPGAAPRRPHRLADAAGLAWTSCPAGSEAYLALTDLLRDAGLPVDIRYEVPAFGAQLELVAAGLAAALVPRLSRTESVPVSYVELTPRVSRHLYLVTRRDDERRVLAELAAQLRAAGGEGLARDPDTEAEGLPSEPAARLV